MPECPINQNKVCEERFKTIFKRLDIIEELSKQINELSASTREMAQSMRDMLRKQEEQDKKLERIETVAFNKYKGIVKILVGAGLGAVVATAINYIK